MKDEPNKVNCSVCDCLISKKGIKKHEKTKKHKDNVMTQEAYRKLDEEILHRIKNIKHTII